MHDLSNDRLIFFGTCEWNKAQRIRLPKALTVNLGCDFGDKVSVYFNPDTKDVVLRFDDKRVKSVEEDNPIVVEEE